MNNLTITIIINLMVSLVFILYSLILYQSQRKKQEITADISKKEKEFQTLDDYFKKMEVLVIRKKISMIGPPKKAPPIKKERSPLVIQKDEEFIIKDGENLLNNLEKELKDAMPRNAIEYKRDLNTLLEVISSLESMDASHYGGLTEEPEDMGKGMLYDSISRKLDKIIKIYKFDELYFIQAEKLENFAFKQIKRLEHKDFEKTLEIMKEIGKINQIIEIGPHIKLLTFHENLKVNTSEKVIISLYTEHNLSKIEDIQKRTLWKPSFLNAVLQKMQSKKILDLDLQEQIISIKGIISSSERFERNQKLEEIIKNKIKKEKDSKKLLGDQQQHNITLNRKKSRIQQEELKVQQTELLAEAKKEAKKLSKIHRKEAEKQSKIEDKERKKILISEKSVTEEGEKTNENQKLVKEIEKIFKNISKITGGIITFSTLLKILKNGAFPKLKKNELLNSIKFLKEKESIIDELSFSGVKIYSFGDAVIDDDMKRLIEQFVEDEELNEEEIGVVIDDWGSKKIKKVIKKFEDQNLIKKDKKNRYYLPGLINAKKKK
ncbi:hypothetical protein DSAG12_03078 [Promethearchaeum syntrophicum]|uniref:Uncharacterized protein n=1 Tax=Promethearchaeum syntrophicum TaxID=2594042 RepID=A0A5B9DEU1_9ARCH|nr:hypothetical protein [Candidatus Prometheoarchaeum syntrophicum]QEE17246.1 hypothetical protein DSAG12_03078 [Candidatus Prometheoarchaeum syntrophicum]